MRKVFIAVALALTTLSACGLYFGESSQGNQQIPDASNTPGDAGWGNDDADTDGGPCCDYPDANTGGCGDGGVGNSDAGLPGGERPTRTDTNEPRRVCGRNLSTSRQIQGKQCLRTFRAPLDN
jgi:hypothetical protein